MATKKAAVELSMSLLVTLIIAIVLFGMGIRFAYNLFSQGEELEQMSQADLDKRIEQLFCSSNEYFCISTSSKEIERGKAYIFSTNVHNVKQERAFNLSIKFSNAFGKDNKPTPGLSASTGGVYNSEGEIVLMWLPESKQFTLTPNENEKTGLRVEVGKAAPKGTYVLDIDIWYLKGAVWDRYDATKKLYIQVP